MEPEMKIVEWLFNGLFCAIAVSAWAVTLFLTATTIARYARYVPDWEIPFRNNAIGICIFLALVAIYATGRAIYLVGETLEKW